MNDAYKTSLNSYQQAKDSWFKAQDEIAKMQMQQYTYDRTEICVIVDDGKASEGIYIVTLDGITCEATGDINKYKKDQSVRVNIPNGDYTEKKFILGLYEYGDSKNLYYNTSGKDIIPLYTFSQRAFSETGIMEANTTNYYGYILPIDLSINSEIDIISLNSPNSDFGYLQILSYNNNELKLINKWTDKFKNFPQNFQIDIVTKGGTVTSKKFDKNSITEGKILEINNVPGDVTSETGILISGLTNVTYFTDIGNYSHYFLYNQNEKPIGAVITGTVGNYSLLNNNIINGASWQYRSDNNSLNHIATVKGPLKNEIFINNEDSELNLYQKLLFQFDIKGALSQEDIFEFEIETQENYKISTQPIRIKGSQFFGVLLNNDKYINYNISTHLTQVINIPSYIKGKLRSIKISFFPQEGDKEVIFSNMSLKIGCSVIGNDKKLYIWTEDEKFSNQNTEKKMNMIWFNSNDKNQYIGFSDGDTSNFDYLHQSGETPYYNYDESIYQYESKYLDTLQSFKYSLSENIIEWPDVEYISQGVAGIMIKRPLPEDADYKTWKVEVKINGELFTNLMYPNTSSSDSFIIQIDKDLGMNTAGTATIYFYTNNLILNFPFINSNDILVKNNYNTLRLAFGFSYLVNTLGCPIGLVSEKDLKKKRKGNDNGYLIDQCLKILNVLTGVKKEIEQYISGGNYLLELIELFQWWSFFAFDRVNRDEFAPLEISGTNISSNQLDAYTLLFNNYKQMLEKTTMQDDYIGIINDTYLDPYSQSFFNRKDLCQYWSLRDCLINSSNILNKLRYYTRIFSKVDHLKNFKQIHPLIEKYIQNINDLIITMDDLFEISIGEIKYDDNSEQLLNKEVLTIKTIENNSNLRFLSGEENYFDNGKLFTAEGSTEATKGFTVGKLQCWRITSKDSVIINSDILNNNFMQLSSNKEPYSCGLKLSLVLDTSQSLGYEIISRYEPSYSNNTLENFAFNITNKSGKVYCLTAYPLGEYGCYCNLNGLSYNKENGLNITTSIQSLFDTVVSSTSTNKKSDYIVKFQLYTDKDFISKVNYSGTINNIEDEDDQDIWLNPQNKNLLDPKKVYYIKLECFKKNYEPIYLFEMNVADNTIIEAYPHCKFQHVGDIVYEYDIPYMEIKKSVTDESSQKTDRAGFTQLATWMPRVDTWHRMCKISFMLCHKKMNNQVFTTLLENDLSETDWEEGIQDLHNRYSIQWFSYQKDNNLDFGAGKGWIKIGELNSGLPFGNYSNNPLQVGKESFYNVFQYIIPDNNEHKIKMILYYNHTKYESNVIEFQSYQDYYSAFNKELDISIQLDSVNNNLIDNSSSFKKLRSGSTTQNVTVDTSEQKIQFQNIDQPGLRSSQIIANEYYVVNNEGIKVPLLEAVNENGNIGASGSETVTVITEELESAETYDLGW